MKTVKNLTTSPQEIHYANGSVEVIGIGGGTQIDESMIFPEEIGRMKMFFEFSEKKKIEPIVKTEKKIEKSDPIEEAPISEKKIERARKYEDKDNYTRQGGNE